MKFGQILKYTDHTPQLADNSFIAGGAQVIGKIRMHENSSVWYNAVLRGDVGRIELGKFSNVQDNSTIHTDYEGDTIIGEYVSVGHGVVLHNVKIGNNSLIGNGAVILDYAEIGNNVIIAAGTTIPPGKKIPDNVMVMGSPYKIARELKPEEIEGIKKNAILYWELAENHTASLK